MKRFIALAVCISVIFACVPLTLGASAASDEDIRTAYERILEGLFDFESEIDIRALGLTVSEFSSDVYQQMIYNEPMMFHISSMSYRYSTSTGIVSSAIPRYSMTEDEYASAKAYVDSEVDAIVVTLPSGLDEYEKALFLHDYLALNFSYDPDVEIRDIYTMLKTGYGVCQGYTLLYDELLSRVGIESSAVYAVSINHMWNSVRLGGEWYHIDVTWDDPVADIDTYQDFYGMARHTNFLVSDNEISRSHECNDFVSANACTDTSFDSLPWKSLAYPIGFVNGSTYYLDYGGIYEFSVTSASTERVGDYTADVRPLDNGKYINSEPYFGSFDGRLIYSTLDRFYAFDPETGDSSLLNTPDIGDEYIIGFYVNGGTLYYATDADGEFDSDTDYLSCKIALISLGDIDADGEVSAFDYALIKRVVLGSYTLSVDMLGYADLNYDGVIDAFDYLLLKRAVLGTYSL